jgi:SAM-dependent methyltransferase
VPVVADDGTTRDPDQGGARGQWEGPVDGGGWGQGDPVTAPTGRSQSFGEAPALYDRFRPGYPRQIVEAIVADTGPRPVLEIGAGTGKATKALVALGKKVHALEPDPRMAAVLDLNCRQPGGVEVLPYTLETAPLAPESYELALAAQSWHWVDPLVGYDLVAAALVPGGRLALMWHTPRPRQGLFGEALAQLYSRMAPAIGRPLPGANGIDLDPTADPAATVRFGDWTRLEHHWQREIDAAGLVGWLCSSSSHRMLPLAARTELLTAVSALVDEFGGMVTIDMATTAHLARRR